MTDAPERSEDDFNPATMADDLIYIGARKYVAADLSDTKDARIAELEAERDELQRTGQECIDAWKARAEAAEAKLAVAIAGLKECENEIDDCVRHEYPHDHLVQERYRQRGFSSNPARATLAQLKGAK